MKWLARRPALSWALYDWGNSAFATTVMAGFFPTFFDKYWNAGVDAETSTLGPSAMPASVRPSTTIMEGEPMSRGIEDDPLHPVTTAIARQAGGDARTLVRGLLGIGPVFGDDLLGREEIEGRLVRYLEDFRKVGVAPVMEAAASG